MKQIGYAIIGCGMIAKYHVEAVRRCPNAVLRGVYDHTPDRARAFARENETSAYLTPEAVWEDPGVDAVCICTPSGLHHPYGMAALQSGKHVLVEKPMALTLEQCDEMISTAEARGLILGVVSQLRFAPSIRQAKQAVEAGVLGKLLCADLYMKYHRSQDYYDSSCWRGTWAMDGGGALMNQGIHGVDLLQYLAGPVHSIFARCKTLARQIEVEDTLSAVTEFRNGAIGVIQATTSMYSGFSRRLELCGENGTIILEEDNILLWDVADDLGVLHDGPRAAEVQSSSDPTRIGFVGHVRQLCNFNGAVLGEEKLLIDGREGRKALEIILGAYRSGRENRSICLEEEGT